MREAGARCVCAVHRGHRLFGGGRVNVGVRQGAGGVGDDEHRDPLDQRMRQAGRVRQDREPGAASSGTAGAAPAGPPAGPHWQTQRDAVFIRRIL